MTGNDSIFFFVPCARKTGDFLSCLCIFSAVCLHSTAGVCYVRRAGDSVVKIRLVRRLAYISEDGDHSTRSK